MPVDIRPLTSSDATGAPGVCWLTQDFNHAARHLHDRAGVLTHFITYQRPGP
jgi:hypothetical protein